LTTRRRDDFTRPSTKFHVTQHHSIVYFHSRPSQLTASLTLATVLVMSDLALFAGLHQSAFNTALDASNVIPLTQDVLHGHHVLQGQQVLRQHLQGQLSQRPAGYTTIIMINYVIFSSSTTFFECYFRPRGRRITEITPFSVPNPVTKYNTCGRRGRLRLRQRLDWIDTLC